MSKLLLLIAGVPCAGKSGFGKRLAAEHSFRHYKSDRHEEGDDHLREDNLGELWEQCRGSRKFSPFIEKMRNSNERIVLEFGFSGLDERKTIKQFQEQGFETWWFDADVNASRAVFEKRLDTQPFPPLWIFDIQANYIAQDRQGIKEAFTPNWLETLRADGTRIPYEDIYRAIIGNREI